MVCVLSTVLSCAVSSALTLPDQEWERIDLDDDHTTIEASDKSRRSSAIPTETAGDLEIPSVLRGFRVVSLGKQAFYGCAQLTSVTIPEGVTNIADQAFYNCSSLTNVVFPSTLKSIGPSAFIGCRNLQKVDIKVSRLTIGDRAFRDCDGLQAIQFFGDEFIVGTRAFFGCGGLRDVNLTVKDITLSEGVFSGGYDPYPSHYGYCDRLTNVLVVASNRVEFGVSAIAGCSALQQVMLTAGAELNVGSTAFSGCTALRQAMLTAGSEMKVGASAFSIGSGDHVSYSSCNHLANVLMVASNRVELGASAFSGCTALQQAALVAPGASSFGDSVFSNCKALQSIELPIGLSGVPQNAFNSCTALQSVSLSSNVTSIAYRAFDTCTSLRSVELAEGLQTIDEQAFYGCATLEDLCLPQSVSKVGDRAFERCDGLGEVVFSGVDTNLYAAAEIAIGERCFYKDFALSNVVFSAPSRIRAFGTRTFSGCESLVRVSLPTDLVEIAESLFESCTALVDVPLPATLRAIGNAAFNGCESLKNFLIPTNNLVTIGNKAFANTKFWNEWPDETLVENNGYILGFKGNPTSVDLPADCKEIPNGMFEGMSALTNVTVPAGLQRVGSRAFTGTGIVSIDFSKTKLTSVGASAFSGCSGLATCVLTEKVTTIPDEAFRDCSSLVSFDIPASVLSIGDSAFRDCVSLETVTGGEGVRTVGDFAFSGCVKLRPFRFQDGVAYGNHVFQYVEWTENVLFPSVGTMAQEYPQTHAEIKSVVMSSTLTGIVDRACAGCVSLESILIPDGVRRVGASAFEGCASLKSVVFPADFSNIGTNAFKGCTAVVSLTVSGGFVVRDVFREAYATIADVRIAEGSTALCDFAFSGCAGLAELVMPAELRSIGDYAFMNCTNLKFVKFMGPQPSANPNIYAGTPKDLWSKVRLNQANKESWTTDGKMLPARWPVPGSDHKTALENDDYANTRRIGWWTDAPKDDPGTQIEFFHYNTTGAHPKMSPEEGFMEEPEREGYDFLGWFTKPYGGILVTEDNYMELGVTRVYAHWVRNRDDHDDPQEWGDVLYDANKTHVYDGYLLDGDQVAGTIRLSLAKGKYDRKEETTSVKLTAKILILGEGKTLSLKGNAEDVGEDGGYGILAKGDREAEIEFTPNELSGSFEGLDIVGSRNMFGERTDWDKRTARAALDDCTDPCSVVLQADGDSPFACGYVALSVTFSSKGKAKIAGTMPDGTKVSASPQLLVFEDRCVLPVVVPLYSGKKGGFGFSITYPKVEGADAIVPYVAELTSWVANPGKTSEFVSDLIEVGIGRTGNIAASAAFSVTDSFDVDGAVVDDSLLPVGVEVIVSGTKWKLPKADTVKFLRDEEAYEIVRDYGNPAGLKLTYAAKTGTFKGSFKVYAVTDAGKSKKHTATVNGAVLDGVGYGTAVIKKVGAVPVVIE